MIRQIAILHGTPSRPSLLSSRDFSGWYLIQLSLSVAVVVVCLLKRAWE